MSAAEGKKLADSMAATFVETSARQNSNVGKCTPRIFRHLNVMLIRRSPLPSIAKVFDLALGEIEKKSPSGKGSDEKGGCVIM